MLDIDNLKQYIAENGNTIPSYKKLTQILHDKHTENSDRKKKQMENFKHYFAWRRSGQSFIIEEIYETPLTQMTQRKSGYKYNIGNILPYLIEKNGVVQTVGGRKTKVLYISQAGLMEGLGFINNDHGQLRNYYQHQARKENRENWDTFIVRWNEYEKELLGAGENQLKREQMLDWLFAEVIKRGHSNIKNSLKSFHKDGTIISAQGYEICFENRQVTPKNCCRYIFPSDAEHKIVYACEQEALKACMERMNDAIQTENEKRVERGGIERPLFRKLEIQDVYMRGYGEIYQKEFKRRMERDLKDEGETLLYCRKAYKLYLPESYTAKDLEQRDVEGFRCDLNNTFMQKLYAGFQNAFPRLPKEDTSLAFALFDIERLAGDEGISTEEYIKTHCCIRNEIRRKDSCYNDRDLGSLEILLAMLICLYPQKTLDAVRKKESLQKKLKKPKLCIKTLR